MKLDLLKAGTNVIAVELHQHEKSDDASFDLTLSANHAVRDTPPSVAILSPPTGTLVRTGEEVSIVVDALDPDGVIKGVLLFVDGRLVGSSATAPATFRWPGTGAGAHRVRAVALNSEQTRRTEITLNVVDNVPPAAHLAAPADGASFQPGQAVEARVEAAGRDGKVARVEFWIREGNFVGSRPQLLATDTTAPYTASLPTDLAPGHYYGLGRRHRRPRRRKPLPDVAHRHRGRRTRTLGTRPIPPDVSDGAPPSRRLARRRPRRRPGWCAGRRACRSTSPVECDSLAARTRAPGRAPRQPARTPALHAPARTPGPPTPPSF